MSVWPSCCSVSPPGGRCRTTAALLPVFWGVRPAAVVSRGTWTMLLFLTFLMWVALHVQEAAAVMWAEFLLGFVGCFLYVHVILQKDRWSHSVLVSEVNVCIDYGDNQLVLWQDCFSCVWCFIDTDDLSLNGRLCQTNFWLEILFSEGVSIPSILIICMVFHIKINLCISEFVHVLKAGWSSCEYCFGCCFLIRLCQDKSSYKCWADFLPSSVSWSSWLLYCPSFVLTVIYLSQQVEDRDYLEKVS